jgi:hypothetical protein
VPEADHSAPDRPRRRLFSQSVFHASENRGSRTRPLGSIPVISGRRSSGRLSIGSNKRSCRSKLTAPFTRRYPSGRDQEVGGDAYQSAQSVQTRRARDRRRFPHALFTPHQDSGRLCWRFVEGRGFVPLTIPPQRQVASPLVSESRSAAPPATLESHPHKTPGSWPFRAWWSWGESNPRPSAGGRTRYDHSRLRG